MVIFGGCAAVMIAYITMIMTTNIAGTTIRGKYPVKNGENTEVIINNKR